MLQFKGSTVLNNKIVVRVECRTVRNISNWREGRPFVKLQGHFLKIEMSLFILQNLYAAFVSSDLSAPTAMVG